MITINQTKKDEIDQKKLKEQEPPKETVIQSPNGTPFKITVADDGSLTTEEINDA